MSTAFQRRAARKAAQRAAHRAAWRLARQIEPSEGADDADQLDSLFRATTDKDHLAALLERFASDPVARDAAIQVVDDALASLLAELAPDDDALPG